jgi:4,5-DOPA dioxygenase extradiol
VQIAVQPARGTAHHVALGRALAPLRDDGVLIVGSGHATHNLRDWIGNRNAFEPMPYAAEFARWLGAAIAAHDERALVDYRERAPSAARAHPTEEHLLPLFVAYGAAGRDTRVERVVDGFENGALARDSFLFGG